MIIRKAPHAPQLKWARRPVLIGIVGNEDIYVHKEWYSLQYTRDHRWIWDFEPRRYENGTVPKDFERRMKFDGGW